MISHRQFRAQHGEQLGAELGMMLDKPCRGAKVQGPPAAGLCPRRQLPRRRRFALRAYSVAATAVAGSWLSSAFCVSQLPSASAQALQAEPDAKTSGRKLTLQDDPAFQKKKYQRNVEEDPGCNRDPKWGKFREYLMGMPEEARVDLAYETTMAWGLDNATNVDEEAKVCLLGLISLQYLFCKFLLEEVGSPEAAANSFRLLDTQAGALHPDLFDKASMQGALWPIDTSRIDALRRSLLRASVGGGTGGPDRRRRALGAYGLHDDDWRSVWSWQPGQALGTNAAPPPVKAGFSAASPGAPKPSFRIYVYEPENHPGLEQLARGAAFCKNNQWGMEIALHDWFLSCPCRTDKPDKADFFFVPHYTACLINHADTFLGCDTKDGCEPTTALFEKVLNESTFYHRTNGGRDHIFVWGSGMGADGPFSTWRKWIPNAIFLMTETELWNPYHNITMPSFTPHKDIVIPGKLGLEDMKSLSKLAMPIEERPFLGHFVGWPRPPHASVMRPEDCMNSSCPLNVRSVLLAMKEEADMHVDVDVPYKESFLGLTSSQFCFVPRGKSAWSSRFFQTFYAGCVPVLLNDLYEPPFGEFTSISKAVIKWPMASVKELVAYLRKIQAEYPEVIYAMQEAGEELRCWYAWPPSFAEWSWIELNKGNFNSTCANWHTRNAFVAVTKLLSTKVTTSRHRFYWPGDGLHAV
eukprot:CAMPEP_0206563504 /NCGR_PEP_ID=MMETSP0325_2-20121206/22888_1 /ASSEMBLY_ACC=CAM_ASM_000347 /TAXON_ID=2866 /ORGANISM="Crypthecodinium cohnii, Strain Seligo" /LENGTH=693 /DNA_ID=CAMNT_0054065927 /DNA_START=17 /DNA_END=2098 /DNA_ORIENTATION=+